MRNNMGKITQRLTVIEQALDTLSRSISLAKKYKSISESSPSEENKEIYMGLQDSMIQRFKYCTDLFWKVLKLHLEEIEKITVQRVSPKGILRNAVQAKIINEDEGEQCISMVTKRNQTSHIYHQSLAEKIAEQIPLFHKLMTTIVSRLGSNSLK